VPARYAEQAAPGGLDRHVARRLHAPEGGDADLPRVAVADHGLRVLAALERALDGGGEALLLRAAG
jgi:hypothetical protein